MRISVRFFTALRELTGRREEIIEYPDDEVATISKVLQTLSRKYGGRFVGYVFDAKTSEAKGFLQFLVNGKSASILNGLQTELKEDDVLAILPPVGGG